MRVMSCLSCGCIPLWQAWWPRHMQRRADREAAAKAQAAADSAAASALAAQEALAHVQAALQADGVDTRSDRPAQKSWRDVSVPPRPATPPVLARPAIAPELALTSPVRPQSDQPPQ